MSTTGSPEPHRCAVTAADTSPTTGPTSPCAVGPASVGHHRHLKAVRVDLAEHRRAHERFVQETEPAQDFLWRRAAGLTKQRADAEDLVQDTLLKAYMSFDSYNQGTNIKPWLSRIMVNTWVDKYRTSQRRPPERLSAEFTDQQVAAGASRTSAGGAAANSAETHVLESVPSAAEVALNTLPKDLRQVVDYSIAGYRNTEIGALLGIPVGTVGSRLHRGKALLRQAVSDATTPTGP